jgi:hypothetical protein
VPRRRANLPKELIPAVLRFCQEFRLYGSSIGAENMCFEASVQFQEMLFEMDLISEEGRDKDWDVVKVWELPDGTILPFSFKCHWVFRYRDVMIDWTARQFDETLAFPEVYRTKNFSPI